MIDTQSRSDTRPRLQVETERDASIDRKPRILELDGLRAFAMVSVFLYHAWAIPLAWMGVDVFFVLSGFLITGILLDYKTKPGYFRNFYERRARRILAPYYLLLFLSSILFGTAWLKQWFWYAFFLSNVPSAFGTVPHDSLDVLWSLAVEEQFYLIWPMLILLLPEIALTWTAVFLIVLAPALRALATPFLVHAAPIYHLMPFRMDLLAAGALIALIWRRWPENIRRAGAQGRLLVIVGTTALFALSRFSWFRPRANDRFTNVSLYSLTMFVAAGLLLWSLQGTGLFCSILRMPWMRYLGRISYSMYLVHVCFILLVHRWVSNPVAVLALSFALTLFYSSLSWFMLEKPLLHSARKNPKGEGAPNLISTAVW